MSQARAETSRRREQDRSRPGGDVCPSLLLNQSALCDVGERPYLPSTFQVQEFCTSDRRRRCPLRFAARLSPGDCPAATEERRLLP